VPVLDLGFKLGIGVKLGLGSGLGFRVTVSLRHRV